LLVLNGSNAVAGQTPNPEQVIRELERLTTPAYIEPQAVGFGGNPPATRTTIRTFLGSIPTDALLMVFRQAPRPETRVYAAEELSMRRYPLLPLLTEQFSDTRFLSIGASGCVLNLPPERTTVRRLAHNVAVVTDGIAYASLGKKTRPTVLRGPIIECPFTQTRNVL
jgi:hypothetical protein